MKRHFSTILFLLLAATAGTLLFHISQNVQQSQNRLRYLRKATLSEQETIHVLGAEWDYLNRPERLENLATVFLQMDKDIRDNLLADASYLPDKFVPDVVAVATSLRINIQPQKKPKRFVVREEINFGSVLENIVNGGGME